jgi:branched-chain amino acid aminotransferase
VTPPLSSGCLAGITRELMLEWCAADGMPVREGAPRELPFEVLDDVLAGRAALAITSSTRNVQPVANLDGTDVAVGDLSLQAQKLFEARLADDVDP